MLTPGFGIEDSVGGAASIDFGGGESNSGLSLFEAKGFGLGVNISGDVFFGFIMKVVLKNWRAELLI